jgi:uncharacterized C2H2 Zn-finger protein
MNCPLCHGELNAKTQRYGWYAECVNKCCGLTVGKVLGKIEFYTDTTQKTYAGLYRTKKDLKKHINKPSLESKGKRIKGEMK